MSNRASVRVEQRDRILIVTIDRPEAKNAVDLATAQAIEAAMDRLDEEPGLFVGVLTGAGGAFSAGADLKAVARGERPATERRGGFGLFNRPPGKPLIAAVEGLALGGGFEACLACDLIVASREAKFGLPEVRHNVVAIGGGLFRLPKRVPYHIAMEMALTGTPRDAAVLHRWGLVNRLSEPGEALADALALATELTLNGPTAIAAAKEIMFRSADWTDAEAWDAQMPIAGGALKSEDRAEGLRAFAEKRKPVWSGR